ncbi:cysteine hydrolase family protein [Jatrophihabitans fulvus]
MTLVVIDLQEVFATGPWGAPRFGDIVPVIERLVAEHEPDVVFTRFVAPSEPQGAWRDYYAQWPFALRPTEDPMWRLVAPFGDRQTLDAPTFGKWDARLAAACGDELVVAGVSTDCCVLSTVLAAADAGRRVRVVRDACAGADDTSHVRALEAMALFEPLVRVF